MRFRSIFAIAALFSAGMAAHANTFGVTVSEGLGPSGGFDAKNNAPASYTASASFTYDNTGATSSTYNLLNFFNNTGQNAPGPTGDLNSAWFSGLNDSTHTNGILASSYSGNGTVTYGGSQVANYGSLASFLGSSASASNFAYNSFYTFNLGTLYAGTVLTINHDDGVALFLNGTQVCGSLTSAATPVVQQSCTLSSSGTYTLQYGRENGTPSILQVNAQTPEPSSMALLGTGLVGMAGMIRRRARKQNVA